MTAPDASAGGVLTSTPRRIAAPAATVFAVLSDPARQAELDGSGMLVGPVDARVIAGVGDVFVMAMRNRKHGDYEMNNLVVEFEQDRRLAWEPQPGRGHPDAGAGGATWGHRWGFTLTPVGPQATVVVQTYDCSRLPEHERAGMDGGRMWLPAMDETLARLDAMVSGR